MIATAIEITRYITADDTSCGVRIDWDGQSYVLVCLETGEELARTASAPSAIAHIGAYLIGYADDTITGGGEGDWSATETQGRELLADLDTEAASLAERREWETA